MQFVQVRDALEFHYPEISLPLYAVEGLTKCFARILQERSAAYRFIQHLKDNLAITTERRLKGAGRDNVKSRGRTSEVCHFTR